MPIMSTMNRFLVISYLLVGWSYANMPNDKLIEVRDGDSTTVTLSISQQHASVQFKEGKDLKGISLDRSLGGFLKSADDLVPLNTRMFEADSQKLFFLIVRKPSQHSNPEGYCGAGHEDYLALMRFTPGGLKLQDKMLIQSCLKSIELASDHGDNPANSVILDPSQSSVHVSWLAHPDYAGQDREIVVQGLRLAVK